MTPFSRTPLVMMPISHLGEGQPAVRAIQGSTPWRALPPLTPARTPLGNGSHEGRGTCIDIRGSHTDRGVRSGATWDRLTTSFTHFSAPLAGHWERRWSYQRADNARRAGVVPGFESPTPALRP